MVAAIMSIAIIIRRRKRQKNTFPLCDHWKWSIIYWLTLVKGATGTEETGDKVIIN